MDDQRLTAEQVRKALGIDILDGQRAPIEVDIGQHRRMDALMKSLYCRISLALQGDILDGAATGVGHAVEQKAIHRIAYAKGKHRLVPAC